MKTILLCLALACGAYANAADAETTTADFEIEGLISPASPKTLRAALVKKLQVKIIDLNLKDTASGWPLLRVQYDSAQHSADDIAQAINTTTDPAGHRYRVHTGAAVDNAAYTEEEQRAIARFGAPSPTPATGAAARNPIPTSAESIASGLQLYQQYCTTCHGLRGGGNGPAAHGITTFPRELWVWGAAGDAADGYLFWFITNGRNEMPPWGVLLEENQRWDLINYIKTLKKPDR